MVFVRRSCKNRANPLDFGAQHNPGFYVNSSG